MPEHPWTPDEACAVLAAMRDVAETDGRLGSVERGLIEGARDHVLGSTTDIDSLPAISPTELAAAVTDPDKRRTLVQFLVLVPYADTVVEAAECSRVDEYAEALGERPDTLHDLHQVRERHIRRLLLDYGRRAIDLYAEASPHGRLRTMGRALRQQHGDARVAARYQALSTYPAGTLGRRFHDFYRDNGFALPGEKHCLAGELLVTHDSAHILGGFGTDGTGEINVAGFEAGMSRNGFGYEMLMEVILDFHLGIDLGVSTVGIETKVGEMDPDSMMAAIRRGLDCNVDLIAGWDFWSVVDRAVPELRERYGIRGVDVTA